MLFKNDETSLQLEIMNYEFPADGGDPSSDDRNWLVLRCTWKNEDGEILRSVRQVSPGERITVSLGDGAITAKVLDVKENGNESGK